MTNEQRKALFDFITTLYDALCGTVPDGALDALLCSHIELFCKENNIVVQDSYSLLIDFYCEYSGDSN